MLNPIDVLYCWQTLMMASVIVGLTQSFKASIEAFLTYKNKDAGLSGKELRARVKMLDSVLLPLFPLMSGALIGAFIPLRPEVLTTYVNQHASGSHGAYALWGAAVGQFADYIFQHGKRMFRGQTEQSSRSPSNPPPSNPPSDPPPSGSGDSSEGPSGK